MEELVDLLVLLSDFVKFLGGNSFTSHSQFFDKGSVVERKLDVSDFAGVSLICIGVLLSFSIFFAFFLMFSRFGTQSLRLLV